MDDIVYSLTLFFTVILITFLLSLISYRCTRAQSNTSSQQSDRVDRSNNVDSATDSNQMTVTVTVEACRPDHQTRVCSYVDDPKLLCSSKANKLCDDTDGGGVSSSPSCCSICLMDYKESDILRVLPECGHFFHVNCVNPWITVHLTCPICRSSVKNF